MSELRKRFKDMTIHQRKNQNICYQMLDTQICGRGVKSHNVSRVENFFLSTFVFSELS